MGDGERVKILWNYTVSWAIKYGGQGFSMALSTDTNFLIADSNFVSSVHLGKLNSSNGAVLASSSSTTDYYRYIYSMGERALSIDDLG